MSTQVQAERTGARSASPRTGVAPGLATLRLGMRALAAVSPAGAAWALDRLWFRAPRTRPDAAALACLAQGRRRDFRLHGRQVASWEWGEQGPWVLLVHGWGGHAGQLHAFVPALLDAGFRVAAFDAPAHGASGGSRHGRRRVSFLEFADALRAMETRLGTLAGIVAHSGGCTAVSLAMRQGWPAPPALVFVAPFCEAERAVAGFARQLGVSGAAVARFHARAVRWLGIGWEDLDIAGIPAQRRAGRQLLVLHDSADREVPLAQSQRLVAAWPDARLQVTHGAGHRRLLRLAEVTTAAVEFLLARPPARVTAPSPRPADSRGELDAAYEATARFWRRP